MKKIILSAAAIFAFSFANAQDSKEGGAGLASGDIVLTGDIAFSSTSQADAKSSGIVLAPGLGYMMSDKLMILGSLGISSGSSNDGTGGEDVKTSGLDFNAGIRYFLTPADKFSLSIGGVFGYGSSKEGDLKTNTIGLSVPVGLHYFMNNNFAINATWGGLGYTSEKADFEGAEAKNSLGLGLNASAISFGLLYKL